MEKFNSRKKGITRQHLVILIAVIVMIVSFGIVLLVYTGMLSSGNLRNGAYEFCILLVSKLSIFGLGAEKLGVCSSWG
jgi:hypothetical protein